MIWPTGPAYRCVLRDLSDLAADEKGLWEAQGLLAKWFRMQPSEMDAMEPREFVRWVTVAGEQIGLLNPD